MDILITIALVYFAYRGYQWYTNVYEEVNGPKWPREVHEDEFANTPPPANEDDYIDYEEVT